MTARGPRGNAATVKLGDVYGEWTITGDFVRRETDGRAMFPCRCSCGTERTVKFQLLRSGESKSCGCARDRAKITHGLSNDRRALWLWREYKLTTDEWDALYDKQLGRCAVCLLTLAESKKVCVDHDHGTGKVRGLLCHGCNVGLGHFFDDVASLQRAITYLLEHQPQVEALVTG